MFYGLSFSNSGFEQCEVMNDDEFSVLHRQRNPTFDYNVKFKCIRGNNNLILKLLDIIRAFSLLVLK